MDSLLKVQLDYNDLDSYNFVLDEPFKLEVDYDNVKYDFVVRFSSINKNLICCGPGAHERNQTTSDGILIFPPYFDRWSWYKYFDDSFIAFSDPVFYYDDEISGKVWYSNGR